MKYPEEGVKKWLTECHQGEFFADWVIDCLPKGRFLKITEVAP
jgi:hypothetical protein